MFVTCCQCRILCPGETSCGVRRKSDLRGRSTKLCLQRPVLEEEPEGGSVNEGNESRLGTPGGGHGQKGRGRVRQVLLPLPRLPVKQKCWRRPGSPGQRDGEGSAVPRDGDREGTRSGTGYTCLRSILSSHRKRRGRRPPRRARAHASGVQLTHGETAARPFRENLTLGTAEGAVCGQTIKAGHSHHTVPLGS